MGGLESAFQRKHMDRSRDIERANVELGGLLDVMSGLSPAANALVKEKIPRFRELCGEDKQCLTQAMKEVGVACENLTKDLPRGWKHGDMIRELERRIGEIEKGLEHSSNTAIH